ncbi:hypothetical protein NPN23_24345, partial [Vibrio parahaemolyticus]|nr:hypothetical protein [Vibrio parahaemolyticus]
HSLPTCFYRSVRLVLVSISLSSNNSLQHQASNFFAVLSYFAFEEFLLVSINVNYKGGACSLRHTIGAIGARFLVTLIHSLR